VKLFRLEKLWGIVKDKKKRRENMSGNATVSSSSSTSQNGRGAAAVANRDDDEADVAEGEFTEYAEDGGETSLEDDMTDREEEDEEVGDIEGNDGSDSDSDSNGGGNIVFKANSGDYVTTLPTPALLSPKRLVLAECQLFMLHVSFVSVVTYSNA
jgi:hypothetical protein